MHRFVPHILSAFIFLFAFVPASGALAVEKVILDTDMVEGFDDGAALLLLANSPDVDLLGVTTVAGNSWVAEGTAFAIRQLELVGRTDVPVHMGLVKPMRPGRVGGIEMEQKLLGIPEDRWVGALSREDPGDWREFYRSRYNREPSFEPGDIHAVNFIIDTVRKHPGEITFVGIGPLGNLALAVRMAPDIVPLFKRVVYMGGAFFQAGNVTSAAEFNWWFDPESAKIAVRTPFREQYTFGLDVCEKVVFTKGHFNAILEVLGEGELHDFIEDAFVGKYFEKHPKANYFIWDVLAAVSVLEPSLILNFVDRNVDIVDNFGLAYGESLAFPKGGGPEGTQTVNIVLDVNKDRFWEMLLEKSYWQPRNTKTDE